MPLMTGVMGRQTKIDIDQMTYYHIRGWVLKSCYMGQTIMFIFWAVPPASGMQSQHGPTNFAPCSPTVKRALDADGVCNPLVQGTT